MKNYLLGILAVTILLLGSIIYKNENKVIWQRFPIPESLIQESASSPPLYLFLFFSKSDCPPCLSELVNILIALPSHFITSGIVSENELKNQDTLRELTKIKFPLFSYQKFKKYLPWYTPTLFGVAPSGEIIFAFPGIHRNMDYLEDALNSIYGKLYPKWVAKY